MRGVVVLVGLLVLTAALAGCGGERPKEPQKVNWKMEDRLKGLKLPPPKAKP